MANRTRETGDVGYRAYKKNFLINGDMSVWQRGNGFSIVGAQVYTADRWKVAGPALSGGSTDVTQQKDDLGASFMRISALGHTGDSYIEQFIELYNVGTTPFSDNILTFSLDVLPASELTGNLQVYISTAVDGTQLLTSEPLPTFPAARTTKSVTVTIPDLSTYTIDQNSFLQIRSRFDTLANGNYNFYQAQLEEGTTATPFEYVSPQEQLAACQRYYETGKTVLECYGDVFQILQVSAVYKVTKRTKSSVNVTNSSSTGLFADPIATRVAILDSFALTGQKDGTAGAFLMIADWTADAEL